MPGSRPLSLPECNALIAALRSKRDRAFVLLSSATGARVNETRLLRVSDVLAPDHKLTGYCLLRRANGKRKPATVESPLPPRVLHALSEYLQAHPRPTADSFLFPHCSDPDRACTARSLQYVVKHAALRAGLPGKITPHSLRKFFGSRVYAASGNDIAIAAGALRHRNPSSTMIYLDLDAKKTREAILDIYHDPSDELFNASALTAATAEAATQPAA